MAASDARAPRADAQRNYERILAVARTVIEEQGTQASLRDVARRAGVGLGTLYRHFPSRDALLEALLRRRFDDLAARADVLGGSCPPHEALARWLDEFVAGAGRYRGLPASIMATLRADDSPLHASCLAMRRSVGALLQQAQTAGQVRPDVTAVDVFALANAVGWIAEQDPALTARREHLLALVLDGLGHSAATSRPLDTPG
ncbi:TetR/AcrR family transcriptional regulator [Dactylosporangium vinaceum]|uniref:TetR/AcrR family transcriptional regulator n=1 Tax=Dactylosporangium vinaceum TaxID=53362 RepID=A0ABV5M2W4_9ACTN|nr:TetR/AcrR family transcriptional regulator [Dactylosporangium vinaceum]UAB99873.1 TetR/AcrR family transcriptional regulator [Dactylosporangium vinaceum]